jgi:hypothetical protein
MNLQTIIRAAIVSAASFSVLALPAAAQKQIKIDFTDETVGAEPKALLPVVGVWRIDDERGNKVLAVDGR